jgi:hypothetical protein
MFDIFSRSDYLRLVCSAQNDAHIEPGTDQKGAVDNTDGALSASTVTPNVVTKGTPLAVCGIVNALVVQPPPKQEEKPT